MKKTSKTTVTTLAAKKAPAKEVKAVKETKTQVASKPASAPAAKAVAPVVKPAAAPAVKAAPAAVLKTKVVANIDIGFGNTLFIRGEGPGLSWEKGVPLECVADTQWALSFAETSRPIVFKFLVNDLTWSVGDDYVVQPGGTIELVPAF